MTIEIFSIGGYEEVGKNMSAVKVGDNIVILDMGISLEKLLLLEELGLEQVQPHLTEKGVIPNDSVLDKYRDKVSAIVISHAHLDHVASVEHLALKYNCPILATPFTIEFMRNSMDTKLFNKLQIVKMNAGEILELGEISIEFVHVTHSVPQTVHPVIHTPEGTIYYAIDYKFDNTQVLEGPPDYKRMKQLGKEGIKALIVESVRADEHSKTPGEIVAKELLTDTINSTLNEQKGIIVTSFSSHIERLHSIMAAAKNSGRQIYFCGRSMAKYIKVAEAVGIAKFPPNAIAGKQKAIKALMEKAAKNKKKYLLITTGGQGEANAVLSRLADRQYPFKIENGDEVLFSCNTIPSPINIQNRAKLENKITAQGGRVFRDLHASGHAAREDHRDLITMLQPEHIIPCHGDIQKLAAYASLATEMPHPLSGHNYQLGETVHIMRDGQKLVI